MGLEGELTVRLDWDGARVRRVALRSTRPHALARVLAGRSVCDAAATVPLLYSVCSHAQGAAASSALGAAAGRAPPPDVLRARSLAVTLEALQEDLRRLLVDLPAIAGLAPAVAPLAAARTALAPALRELRAALDVDAAGGPPVAAAAALGAALRAIVEDAVLGGDADAFASLATAAGFERWARGHAGAPAGVVRCMLDATPRLGASSVRTMPEPTREAVDAALVAALDADPSFVRAPHWHGEAVETGALARLRGHAGLADVVAVHGNGVVARVCARVVDVARSVAALAHGAIEPRVAAWSPRPGEGVASVHTARGLLVHRARVAGGRVRDYAIVAPTEWNFHPDGALARGLADLAAGSEAALAREAGLAVQSLDPCVACRVEVAHA
ncbi:MAG: hydrogenase assembly protein HupF [Betaproteobacteria bacterium]|nr:MAG: hydrogenase assembly protein HupF [Betaproteobacteria bacterium]